MNLADLALNAAVVLIVASALLSMRPKKKAATPGGPDVAA